MNHVPIRRSVANGLLITHSGISTEGVAGSPPISGYRSAI